MPGNPASIPLSARDRGWSFRDLVTLVKGHLSLYIALTAVAGHAMAQNRLTLASLGIGLWVLILSCGAGVMNNIQDRRYDRRFARTRHRVMARGALGLMPALGFALFLVLVGVAGLWISYASSVPALLGCAAVCAYNGIYTPMKKQGPTARFRAMVPGTLCGMIPPALGWAAVDRGLAVADLSGLYILMAGLGVWQFPHFLLVFLKEERENPVTKDEGAAGDGQTWSEKETLIQVVIWSALFGISMMLFVMKGWIPSSLISVLLSLLALGLPLTLSLLFLKKGDRGRSLDLGFWVLNFSMLAYMVFILLDRV